MTTTHTDRLCPHPDCLRSIPAYQYACKPHWKGLPWTIREKILRLYRRWEADPSEERLAQLRAAQKRAADHWKDLP